MAETMDRHTHTQPHRWPGGFTLVEVMVASLLLAVGMMAALGMQYTALNGYINSRDLTNASAIGERIISIMRTESQQWRTDGDLGSAVAVYDKGKAGYWAQDSLLNTMKTTSWTWHEVFSNPVDSQFSDAGARRYCVYVRGGIINDPESGGATTETGMMRVHIAVVYPSSDRTFPGTSDSSPAGSCTGKTAGGSTMKSILDPPSGPKDVPKFELQGYRIVHMATVISQRGFLSNTRSRGST